MMNSDERARKAIHRLSDNLKKLFEARQLVESGNYEKALDAYMTAIHGSVGALDELQLEASLSALLKHHPVAREPLLQRRDELAERIVGGHLSRGLNDEWLALSRALGDSSPEPALLERMNASTVSKRSSADYHSLQIIQNNLDLYLREKNYRSIESFFDRLGHQFLTSWVDVESCVLFPTSLDGAVSTFISAGTESLIEQAALLFEASIGLNRSLVASELVRRVFAVRSDIETFHRFIKAAKRADSADLVASLSELAHQQLTPIQSERLRALL